MSEDRPKISKDDPAYVALTKVVEALHGFSRKEQLRIMVSVCTHLDDTTSAERFLAMLTEEIEAEEEALFNQEMADIPAKR